MSFLEPDPIPRRYKAFLAGVIGLSLLLCLDAFRVVDLHGWVGPAQMLFVALFLVYDARVRRRETRNDSGGRD